MREVKRRGKVTAGNTVGTSGKSGGEHTAKPSVTLKEGWAESNHEWIRFFT